MKQEMQIILEVNNQAENFYDDAVKLGDHAAYALTARHRSQMTGLENIAESALKVSDVLDYVKRQTARFAYWRQTFSPGPLKQDAGEPIKKVGITGRSSGDDNSAEKGFGERLMFYLEKDLLEKRNAICSKNRLDIDDKTDENRKLRRRVYLLLIRQFLRQMVAQYEFRVTLSEKSEKSKKGA